MYIMYIGIYISMYTVVYYGIEPRAFCSSEEGGKKGNFSAGPINHKPSPRNVSSDTVKTAAGAVNYDGAFSKTYYMLGEWKPL